MSSNESTPRFETLQLHAGLVCRAPRGRLSRDANLLSALSQEPDPTTKSRAVPIYATTVRAIPALVQFVVLVDRSLIAFFDCCSPSPSMTPLMARGSLVSRSSATSTAGS